ncbi:MAG: hypothetical protein OEZ06_06280 [Myxococcales bacterium]|nr:hypothetical protein [Myxococcales bacterium]
MRLPALLLLTCGLLWAGCGDDRPPSQAGSFNRPNRVALACVSDGAVVPLASCHTSESDNDDELVLYALVTQSERGEVAAVDTERINGILDARQDIPGFTFIPVGEVPIAIVVPPEHPEVTYVANYASRDVYVMRTATLLTLDDGRNAALQKVSLRAADAPAEEVAQSPADMVVTPAEDALFVSLPEAAALLRLPIVRCGGSDSPCPDGVVDGMIDVEAMTQLPLSAPQDGPTDGAPQTLDEPESYAMMCGYAPPNVARKASPRIVAGSNSEPRSRPGALSVDRGCDAEGACTARLLVADEGLPFIHVIDPDATLSSGGDAVVEAYAVGVPTRDVVASPRVPVGVESEADAETRYVYAIDATDGSVMVLQDGRVLRVDSRGNGDDYRIAFDPRGGSSAGLGAASAVALEVLTPGFDPKAGAAQYLMPNLPDGGIPEGGKVRDYCFDEENPELDLRRLRGVFLAVALSDGSIRIVDVHDMELGACRSCSHRFEVEIDKLGETPTKVVLDDSAPWVPAVGDRLVQGDVEAVVVAVDFQGRFEIEVDVAGLEVGAAQAEVLGQLPILQRHMPRLRNNLTEDLALDRYALNPVASSLGFVVGSTSYSMRSDGTVGSPDAPGLACITCPEGLLQVYPEPNAATVKAPSGDDDAGVAEPDDAFVFGCTEQHPALVCAQPDPWTVRDDEWRAIYEGALPGATGDLGRFVEHADAEYRDLIVDFEGEADFCAAGVLGRHEVATAFEDADCVEDVVHEAGAPDGPEGDQLLIVSLPPEEDLLVELIGSDDPDTLAACAALRESMLGEVPGQDPLRVAFQILSAHSGRLFVDPRFSSGIEGIESYRDIQRCNGNRPLSYRVHTRGSYLVRGLDGGLSHRVRTEPGGRCGIDPSADPMRGARARVGCTYRNREIAFRLGHPIALASDRPTAVGAEFRASIYSPAGSVRHDASQRRLSPVTVVPVQLHYDPVTERLYLVDVHRRGLMAIPLNPLPDVGTNAVRNWN